MSRQVVIGIDGGTEGLRVGVFHTVGKELAFASAAYRTHFPEPGYAEQNPEDWWQALVQALPKALSEAGVQRDDIIALAIDTTCCSVCALDKEGRPLRPALLWMDVRAKNQAAQVLATKDAHLCVNNCGRGPVSAEWMIPKALWLKQNQPNIYNDAVYICEYQDYMNFRLTGTMTASTNNSAVRWHFQHDKDGAPRTLLEKLGAAELLEKWPLTHLVPGTVIGPVTRKIAEEFGLPQDLPVVQGGADAFIAMAGLGVVRPGQIALVTGSSHLQLAITNTKVYAPGIWGAYGNAIRPDIHVVEGGQASTGSAVNWFQKTFAANYSYKELDDIASELPIGCDGVIAQDHFQGNRTPYTDASSRGAFTGLSLKHTQGHMFRALLESVAYGTRLTLETMVANGIDTQHITICGGVTRSPFWLQMHADVTGLPMTMTDAANAPALGSAVYAAIGAGVFHDLDEATSNMVHIDRVIEPDTNAHNQYYDSYMQYQRAYASLKGIEND